MSGAVRGGDAKGGQEGEVVRLVERLGTAWGAVPSPVLRSGGVGVRELRRTATDLDVGVEEAALVDGANRWQRFRAVTVPHLRPTILLVVTLGVIGTW